MTDPSPSTQKGPKRRASTSSLLKPYLDEGVPIERLEVVALPNGTVRVFVKPEKPMTIPETSTDWDDAPAFS